MSTPSSDAGNSLPRRSKPAIVTIPSRRDKRKGGVVGLPLPPGGEVSQFSFSAAARKGEWPDTPALRMAPLSTAPCRRQSTSRPHCALPGPGWPSPGPPRKMKIGEECLHPIGRHQPREMPKRPVVGPFRIVRKAAPRELPGTEVVADAFAAQPLPGTGIVSARANLRVLRLSAFHLRPFHVVPTP